MVLRADTCGQSFELHVNAPADDVPRFANMSEFSGPGAGVAIGRREASTLDLSSRVRENQVARGQFPQEIVVSVSRAITFAFRRPDVFPFELMSKRLFVVDPPVAHPKKLSL